MNQMLLEQLHRYTEDREIDYSSAQYLGASFGVIWENQQQLVEFKQAIDLYLKTFSAENFAIVESKINVLTGKNTRSTEEAEQLTTYAVEPKTLRKPKQRKVLKSKKINESRNVIDEEGDRENGEYKKWYPNGQLWVQCFYKDGVLHGEYKEWYDNGKLSKHHFYKNGQKKK